MGGAPASMVAYRFVMPRVGSLVLFVSAVALTVPGPALGCSYAVASPSDRLAASDGAVFGHVLWVHYGPTAPREPDVPYVPGQTYRAKIHVNRIYKGPAVRTLRIEANTNEPMCGLGVLRPRQRIALLIDGRRSPHKTELWNLSSLWELNRATGRAYRRPPHLD